MNVDNQLNKKIMIKTNQLITRYGSSVDTKDFESHRRRTSMNCYRIKPDVPCVYWLRKQYCHICGNIKITCICLKKNESNGESLFIIMLIIMIKITIMNKYFINQKSLISITAAFPKGPVIYITARNRYPFTPGW